MGQKPRLTILTGTTASGKSAFLYQNFKDMPLTVINADSRQVYHKLRISSASPSDSELALFVHELYNFLPLDAVFSAGAFSSLAGEAVERAHRCGRMPVICGGTYFYIHSLLHGLLPEIVISPQIREAVEAMGDDEAWRQFSKLDPLAASRVHRNNRVRINRQLMLCLAHGGPISQIPRTQGLAGQYDIQMFIFAPKRDKIERRVTERVEKMIEVGMIAEAESVLRESTARGHNWKLLPALTGIGIREFFEAYDATGRTPAELDSGQRASVQEKIVRNTMQLVKRQMTWFRNSADKLPNAKTVDPSYEHELIAALAREFMQVRAQ